jgi:hypothetical protein
MIKAAYIPIGIKTNQFLNTVAMVIQNETKRTIPPAMVYLSTKELKPMTLNM